MLNVYFQKVSKLLRYVIFIVSISKRDRPTYCREVRALSRWVFDVGKFRPFPYVTDGRNPEAGFIGGRGLLVGGIYVTDLLWSQSASIDVTTCFVLVSCCKRSQYHSPLILNSLFTHTYYDEHEHNGRHGAKTFWVLIKKIRPTGVKMKRLYNNVLLSLENKRNRFIFDEEYQNT
jgi:hypothetical protein